MTEIAFIESVLTDVASYVRERYLDRTHLEVSTKTEANDLLTEVDLETQRRVVARINAQFPGDIVVAEEANLNVLPPDTHARTWFLDPIDGTQNFVRGIFPLFGVSLAFAQQGIVRSGGVMLPMNNDLFLGERGAGAFRSGKRLHVANVSSVALARADIDFSVPSHRDETLQRATRLIVKTGQIRCFCSAVVAMCSIASGDADIFFNVGLSPWDYAASQVILEEAGGKTSRLDGSPLHFFDKRRGVLATNGHIHAETLSLLD
ncbi:MAG: inositol monophosphatase [Candidatus Hydrogenedentes bacterium]|nr:inositol monophosphatase [Candidatus Hydrogenedentota bacterium]